MNEMRVEPQIANAIFILSAFNLGFFFSLMTKQ